MHQRSHLSILGLFGIALLASCAAALAPASLQAQNRLNPRLSRNATQPQLRNPSHHPDYAVELEPHGVLQWSHIPRYHDVGVGVGVRASIPLFRNGPIPRLNNSLAVSFGIDWAHFSACGKDEWDCGADDFWFPVVGQWNFFITRAWSVFPEFGFAVHHATWGWDEKGGRDCDVLASGLCRHGDSNTRVAFVAWAGTRFAFSDRFALTFRVGTPAILAGVSFML